MVPRLARLPSRLQPSGPRPPRPSASHLLRPATSRRRCTLPLRSAPLRSAHLTPLRWFTATRTRPRLGTPARWASTLFLSCLPPPLRLSTSPLSPRPRLSRRSAPSAPRPACPPLLRCQPSAARQSISPWSPRCQPPAARLLTSPRSPRCLPNRRSCPQARRPAGPPSLRCRPPVPRPASLLSPRCQPPAARPLTSPRCLPSHRCARPARRSACLPHPLCRPPPVPWSLS